MTSNETKIIDRLRAGHRLGWCGDSGPEMSGFPFWPSKRVVQKMLADGVLVWGEPLNETQKQVGICPIILPEVK